MATKYLTSSKVDDIIKVLLQPIKEESAKAKNTINDVAVQILLKYANPEVLKFMERYPTVVKYMDDISFKLYKDPNDKDYNYEWYYLHFNKLVPNIEWPENCNDRYKYIMDLINNEINDRERFEKSIADYVATLNKKAKIKAQLRCALSQFKTYNQLKDNYPEAYKVLLEDVDKEILITGNGCDNIESVRAELSRYNKPTK